MFGLVLESSLSEETKLTADFLMAITLPGTGESANFYKCIGLEKRPDDLPAS